MDGAAQIQDPSGALLPTPYTELSLLKSRELAASQVWTTSIYVGTILQLNSIMLRYAKVELSQLEALVVILRAEHVSTGSR